MKTNPFSLLNVKPLQDRIKQLESENKRLREALEKYADESNWANCYLEYYEKRSFGLFNNGYDLAQSALNEGNEND